MAAMASDIFFTPDWRLLLQMARRSIPLSKASVPCFAFSSISSLVAPSLISFNVSMKAERAVWKLSPASARGAAASSKSACASSISAIAWFTYHIPSWEREEASSTFSTASLRCFIADFMWEEASLNSMEAGVSLSIVSEILVLNSFNMSVSVFTTFSIWSSIVFTEFWAPVTWCFMSDSFPVTVSEYWSVSFNNWSILAWSSLNCSSSLVNVLSEKIKVL